MAEATGIPAADIAQAAIGLGEEVVGLINAGKTKREAERLQKSRPKYNISPLVDQDLALAKSDLAQGMSSAASKAYTDLDNSQFSSSLDAILKSGGSPNNIGAIYGNNQEGRLRLAQMKDQLRLNQIQNVIRQSERKQQEQQTQWQLNEFAPWEDRAQANAQARMGAQQQIYGGLNTLGSAVSNFGQEQREKKQFNIDRRDTIGFNNGFATGVPDTGNLANSSDFVNPSTLTPRPTGYPYFT